VLVIELLPLEAVPEVEATVLRFPDVVEVPDWTVPVIVCSGNDKVPLTEASDAVDVPVIVEMLDRLPSIELCPALTPPFTVEMLDKLEVISTV
jgi:hypothetical protein